MSFLDRARERAMAATDQVRAAAEHAMGPRDTPDAGARPGATSEGALPSSETSAASDGASVGPAGAPARHGLDAAKSALSALLDRLDPNLMADVVIRATTLQERANVALHAKGSPYRIDGIGITATVPPQISFTIGRSGEPEA